MLLTTSVKSSPTFVVERLRLMSGCLMAARRLQNQQDVGAVQHYCVTVADTFRLLSFTITRRRPIGRAIPGSTELYIRIVSSE